MIGLAFQVDAESEAQFRRALDGLSAAQKDWRRAWPQIAAKFYEIERRWFNSQGNGSWEPLSPAYASAKEVSYPGRPILQRTGALVGSLTSGPFADNTIYQPAPDSLLLGSSLPYAAYHQRSTPRMPARKPIDMSPQDRNDLRDVAREAFGKLGLELGFEVYTT